MAVIVEMTKPNCCLDCSFRTCLLGEIICPVAGIINDVHSLLPDCPIIGEIPYELENFIIGISQLPREKPKTATEAKEALAYEELERRMKKEM